MVSLDTIIIFCSCKINTFVLQYSLREYYFLKGESLDKMAEEKSILLMFSGGKDSFLSALRLSKEFPDYTINLAVFDNGCMTGLKNAETTVQKLKSINKYSFCFRGYYNTYGIAREFFFPYFNMKAEDLAEKYPALTASQFHCLICETSMYLQSFWLARKWDCEYVANGARECQEFVVEQEDMIDRYQELAKEFGLAIKYPVYDIEDDWELENEIFRYGLIPKTYEPKCIIGCPTYGTVDSRVIESTVSYYDKEIYPRIKRLKFLNPDVYKNYTKSNDDD